MLDKPSKEKLREWSAIYLMGWKDGTSPIIDFHTGVEKIEPSWVDEKGNHVVFQKDWTPDLPTAPASQILGVIERMKQKGWRLVTQGSSAMFETLPIVRNYKLTDWFVSSDFLANILEAAWATGDYRILQVYAFKWELYT